MKPSFFSYVAIAFWLFTKTVYGGDQVWTGFFVSQTSRCKCLCGLINFETVHGSLKLVIKEGAKDHNATLTMTYEGLYYYGCVVKTTMTLPALDKIRNAKELRFSVQLPKSRQRAIFWALKYRPNSYFRGIYESSSPYDRGTFILGLETTKND